MEITSQSELKFTVTFTVTEIEARALNAMVCYGYDPFIKVFLEKMGVTYMKPHQDGLKTLFKTITSTMPKHLDRIDNTRKAFNSKI